MKHYKITVTRTETATGIVSLADDVTPADLTRRELAAFMDGGVLASQDVKRSMPKLEASEPSPVDVMGRP